MDVPVQCPFRKSDLARDPLYAYAIILRSLEFFLNPEENISRKGGGTYRNN